MKVKNTGIRFLCIILHDGFYDSVEYEVINMNEVLTDVIKQIVYDVISTSDFKEAIAGELKQEATEEPSTYLRTMSAARYANVSYNTFMSWGLTPHTVSKGINYYAKVEIDTYIAAH